MSALFSSAVGWCRLFHSLLRSRRVSVPPLSLSLLSSPSFVFVFVVVALVGVLVGLLVRVVVGVPVGLLVGVLVGALVGILVG